MEAGENRMEYSGRSKKCGGIRTLQQINVIAMKDGVTPQVTEHRNIRAAGNHLAITILEDRRLHIASKSIQNKGNKREVRDNSKGLKVKKKNKDFKFSPTVFTDWLRNVKFSTHLDRSMLYGESSFFLCENGGEEENAPAVGLLETVTEEGVGSPTFICYFWEHCRENRPEIVALLETRISRNAVEKVIRIFGFQNYFRVEAFGFSGGIWLLFYASPQVKKRKLVWKHLINLDPGEYEAWTLGGDFNSILQLDEKEGGSCRGSGVSNLIVEFVFELGLFEVDFRGPKFTWRRCNLFKLLDRCLMNSFWADVFPVTMVLHLDRVSSDHCPLLLKAQSTTRVQGNRPFRFIAAWQDHPQFKNFLLETWNNEMDVLTNINSFQIKAIDWNLKDMLKKELEEVLQQEESLWLQKSRNQWILNGDKNTKYFHSCTMLRRRHNYVGALKATDGSWISDQEVLCLMAVNYYKDLFTSSKISETQTNFVPDRSIDNIIVVQEVVQSMRLKKGKIGYMAIKIDLDKIYDRLEWPFIDDTLKELQILTILGCLSCVVYLPSRPRLAYAIAGAVNNGMWKPIRLCRNGLVLSHLFFADDLVLFVEGRTESGGGVPLVYWENICKPIVKGGMGIRKLNVQNEAFLMKLAYKLVVNSDQLWARVLRSKYKWVKLVPESINCTRSSYVWKDISQVWNEVRNNATTTKLSNEYTGWKWSVDRQFSFKSAYELRRGILNDDTHKEWEQTSDSVAMDTTTSPSSTAPFRLHSMPVHPRPLHFPIPRHPRRPNPLHRSAQHSSGVIRRYVRQPCGKAATGFRRRTSHILPYGFNSFWSSETRVVEQFHMNHPIPPYLFAFAIGELGSREVGPWTTIYAEVVDSLLDVAAKEFSGTEEMIMQGEKLFGKYPWERFNLLILPPSFPYGGMENPMMVFLTPTVIKGDASGVQVVAHELAHSWTGSLITNWNNEHFWLNEGFTTYAERRIVEAVFNFAVMRTKCFNYVAGVCRTKGSIGTSDSSRTEGSIGTSDSNRTEVSIGTSDSNRTEVSIGTSDSNRTEESICTSDSSERKEASALPIQVEREEAWALPIQVEREEASALPIQVFIFSSRRKSRGNVRLLSIRRK
ncbi:Detected protein of unknown function [Hibiscus syriacus]|uniref:Peptidase M1 membrane alanine aminopeptidase domain-containing protein n=1 Tax=Hibiscus syriacus TaxID=106335 RepID=A0A6A2ZUX8_HIBSY|nr:Detected protein of unknown function [Hibiscus syriacus]